MGVVVTRKIWPSYVEAQAWQEETDLGVGMESPMNHPAKPA